MTIDTNDAAYWYVQEANVKEARNAAQREKRDGAGAHQNPLWCIIVAVFMVALARYYFQVGNYVVMSIMILAGGVQLQQAYRQWTRRKSQ